MTPDEHSWQTILHRYLEQHLQIFGDEFAFAVPVSEDEERLEEAGGCKIAPTSTAVAMNKLHLSRESLLRHIMVLTVNMS